MLHKADASTQRTSAKEVSSNVGSINFCLKAMVDKGWAKMGNFSNNPNKLGSIQHRQWMKRLWDEATQFHIPVKFATHHPPGAGEWKICVEVLGEDVAPMPALDRFARLEQLGWLPNVDESLEARHPQVDTSALTHFLKTSTETVIC